MESESPVPQMAEITGTTKQETESHKSLEQVYLKIETDINKDDGSIIKSTLFVSQDDDDDYTDISFPEATKRVTSFNQIFLANECISDEAVEFLEYLGNAGLFQDCYLLFPNLHQYLEKMPTQELWRLLQIFNERCRQISVWNIKSLEECSDTSAQLIFSVLFGMSKGQTNPGSCLPEKLKMFFSNSTVLNCNRLYISNFAGSAGISISGGESSLSFMSADSGITVNDLIPWLHHKGRGQLRQLCLFTTRYALDRLFGNIDDMMEEFEKQNSSNKPNYIVELQARNLSEYVSRSFTHRENEKTGEVFISSRWNETEYVHARQCPKELCGTVIDGKSILRCSADFPEFMKTAGHDHDLKNSNISGLGQNNGRFFGCLVLSNNHMKSEYIGEENQVKYDKGNLSQ